MIHSLSHQRLVPRADAEAEVLTIWMVGLRTTSEVIWEIYNEVYQLKREVTSPPTIWARVDGGP